MSENSCVQNLVRLVVIITSFFSISLKVTFFLLTFTTFLASSSLSQSRKISPLLIAKAFPNPRWISLNKSKFTFINKFSSSYDLYPQATRAAIIEPTEEPPIISYSIPSSSSARMVPI